MTVKSAKMIDKLPLMVDKLCITTENPGAPTVKMDTTVKLLLATVKSAKMIDKLPLMVDKLCITIENSGAPTVKIDTTVKLLLAIVKSAKWRLLPARFAGLPAK